VRDPESGALVGDEVGDPVPEVVGNTAGAPVGLAAILDGIAVLSAELPPQPPVARISTSAILAAMIRRDRSTPCLTSRHNRRRDTAWIARRLLLTFLVSA
ncbi:MAG TPA: hypothetical protein DEU95_02715, partial [Chloroflexi bacterium]|nr:hypothetical protein [Chloroflexota bacterium]